MTSERADDPYRSPVVQTEIDPVAATPGRGEIALIAFVGLSLGLVAFLGTCFGIGLLGVNVYGPDNPKVTPVIVLAWAVGILAGLAAGGFTGRALYRNAQETRRRKLMSHEIEPVTPASESTSETP